MPYPKSRILPRFLSGRFCEVFIRTGSVWALGSDVGKIYPDTGFCIRKIALFKFFLPETSLFRSRGRAIHMLLTSQKCNSTTRIHLGVSFAFLRELLRLVGP